MGVFLLTISLFSAFSAVMILGRASSFKPALAALRQAPPPLSANSDKIIFVFKNSNLINATPAALIYVGAPIDRNAVWQALLQKLEIRFPNAAKNLQALADLGVEFELPDQDQSLLSGRCRQGKIEIEIGPNNSTKTTTTSAEQTAIDQQFIELIFLREVADLTPNLVWKVDVDGSINWVNRAYLDLLDVLFPVQMARTPPYQHVLKIGEIEENNVHRQLLTLPESNKPQWYETRSFTQTDGSTLNFAFRADHVIQAEDALRNFVQTLTKTFAHLPIGLAIFDRNRQLALFNPALAELTALEPTWLTARPTLTAFLDRLRENRHVPEPKNYKTWRDRIQALERAAEDGTYEENWPLPTGQTYRVTGRPHPEGAVAFLFEDITSSISLQREFRGELELGQSILDSIEGAVAVFAADGDLVVSNDGFAELWGIDPREMLARLSIDEAVRLWRVACRPNPIWNRLLDYAAKPVDRSAWESGLLLKCGSKLKLEVSPLAQGAFLCKISRISAVKSGRGRKTAIKAKA